MTIHQDKLSQQHPGFHSVSHDRPLLEQSNDAYRMVGKLAEPTVCPKCNAVFHDGRWQWGAISSEAHQVICPACHRQDDHYPAGYLFLTGDFLKAHSADILRLIYNKEQHERAEHPLKRIMTIEPLRGAPLASSQQDAGLLVTTTDIHLARGLAEAVHHAYKGQLELQYNAGENQLRAYWTR